MFALRLMLQAAESLDALLAKFRHWLHRTFNRDAFLKSSFDELQPILIAQMNAVSTNAQPADCVEVVAMMTTTSLDARLARDREHDAVAIFCISRMPIAEMKPIFSSVHRAWWLGCGVEKNLVFHAITNPDFYKHAKTFAESKWAQRLSPELVELMVKAYAIRERVSAPLFMVIWTKKGMSGSAWLRRGMNTTRAHGMCLADAVSYFDRMSEKVVQRIRKARDVD